MRVHGSAERGPSSCPSHARALRIAEAAEGPGLAADGLSLALFALADRVAASSTTVLIEGPTGAGKEMLAQRIHARSARADQPFVAVNCAALPEAMLEALLFGHERGAFTGAQQAATGLFRAAHGGTLFLDEVGEMPLGLQAKLLRALQEREILPLGATRPVAIDVRIVAATNRDLDREVDEGRFRDDLRWRLAVFPLRLAPLAERVGDILPLAALLLERLAAAEGRKAAGWTPEAARALEAHSWPGNVRELDNRLQRGLILAGEAPIDTADLGLDCDPPLAVGTPPIAPAHPGAGAAAAPPPLGLADAVKHREAEAIRAALRLSGGQKRRAAQQLGISERTLRYKLAELAGRPRARAGQRQLAEAC